jgi:hypothetical protein
MTDTTQFPTPGGAPPMPPPAAAVPPPAPPAPGAPPSYPVEPAAAPQKGRRWLMPVLIGFIALLLGVGIGFAASQPSKSSLQDEKKAAQEQVVSLQAQVDQLGTSVGSAQSARTTCQKAAADAKDLADQYENFLGDFFEYWGTASGSAAEASWMEHMNTQGDQMSAQRDAVEAELTACTSALG